MRLEKGSKVGTARSPMIDHDSSGLNFQQVQGAASDDEPDDSLAIVRRQLAKALGGTSQDRLMGVLQGPLNGVEDGPVLAGICMDEVEVGRGRGKDGLG